MGPCEQLHWRDGSSNDDLVGLDAQSLSYDLADPKTIRYSDKTDRGIWQHGGLSPLPPKHVWLVLDAQNIRC